MQSAWLLKPYPAHPPCWHWLYLVGGGGASLTVMSPETVGSRKSLAGGQSLGQVVRACRPILSPAGPLSSTEISNPAMVAPLGARASMAARFPYTLRQVTGNGPVLPKSPSNVTVPVGLSPTGPLRASRVYTV